MTGQKKKSKNKAALPVKEKDEGSQEKAQSAKGNLVVFGDDDDDDEQVVTQTKPAVKKPVTKPVESEEESDDDEAPEAVATAQITSRAEKLAQSAQKAAQEQAATLKRKRQEKDALFKKQASERRQLEEEIKKQALTVDNDESSDEEEEAAVSGPSQRNKLKFPNVLPEEFLTDASSDDDEDITMEDAADSRPRKRNVAAVERRLKRFNRGPRDESLGTTVYRVTKTTDQRLAPQSKKYARSGKDVLLRRNRTAVKPRAGFFTKK